MTRFRGHRNDASVGHRFRQVDVSAVTAVMTFTIRLRVAAEQKQTLTDAVTRAGSSLSTWLFECRVARGRRNRGIGWLFS